MTDIIYVTLFALSLLLSLGAVVFAVRVALGENKKRLMAISQASHSAPIGNIGVSLLCIKPAGCNIVSDTLATKYPASEVIVTVDSSSNGDMVAHLIKRYNLLAIDYVPSHSIHVSGVRRLYRSRSRAYRRLILIDMTDCRTGTMYDAAAGVASYDYLLLIPCGVTIQPHTVGRMVMEIGLHDCYSVSAAVAIVGAPVAMVALESYTCCGGFDSTGNIISGKYGIVCPIYEPLAGYIDSTPPAARFMAVSIVVAVTVAVVASVIFANTALYAFATNIVATVAVLLYVSSRLISEKNLWSSFSTATYNFYLNLAFDIVKYVKLTLPLLNQPMKLYKNN